MTARPHTHGTVNTTCDHPDCKAARARWSKQYDLDVHRGLRRTTDATRARAHIASLRATGWTNRSIAAAADISDTIIGRVLTGKQETLRHTTVDRILAIDPTVLPTHGMKGTRSPLVSRVGSRRRIQALLTIGWSHHLIKQHSGLDTQSVLNSPGQWVTRETHDKIATAYRALARRPGPSGLTRERAQRLGYHSPMAWVDIDHDLEPNLDDEANIDVPDYDENVVLRILAGRRHPATPAERAEVLRRWTGSDKALEAITGWNVRRERQDAAA